MPDLVIMDIMLAGEMDGIEAADIIRTRWDIPVVFLSAYSNQKLLDRANLVYPFGYLLKPFQNDELKVLVSVSLHIAQVNKERDKAEKKVMTQLEELRRWQYVMLEREERIQELKKEVNALCRLQGEEPRYPSQEPGMPDEKPGELLV